jgi:multidrug resistance protein, MATE family
MNKDINLKNIFKLVGPNIIAQATVVIVGFIDLFFISKTGIQATAAISIANITTSSLYNFLDGFRTSSTVMIARFLGANDHKNIATTMKMGILYSLFTGLVIAVCAFPISKFIYWLTTGDKVIMEIGASYLYFRLLAAPFTLLFFSLTGFFFGFKNTTKPLLITVIICFFDGGLDYIFIYGKLGFPAMGIRGAAVATLCAYVIGSICGTLMLVYDSTIRPYLNLKIPVLKNIKKEFLKMTVEVGFYSGFIRIAIFMFATIFSVLGSSALAAHQIAYQVFIATFMIPKGFSTATTILISNLLGAGKKKQIVPTLIKINIVALIATSLFNGIVWFYSTSIVTLFASQNITVITSASQAIKLVCASQIFFSLYMVFLGILTAYKDTRFLMYAEFVSEYVIFIPLTYVLAIKMNYGVQGGYVAFLAWAVVDAIFLITRFFTNKEIKYSYLPSVTTEMQTESLKNDVEPKSVDL